VHVNTLVAAMPGLSQAKANSYLGPMEAAMQEFGITSELRSAMWLAQVGHESASLVYFEELASGSAYEGRRDLGNTQPGDGVRFKGRGPIQITGRANYTHAGNALKVDLIGNPAQAADPRVAFRLSAWWWNNHGLNEIADRGDIEGATKRINGGLNGLADRKSRYASVRRLGGAVVPGGSGSAPTQGSAAQFPFGPSDYLGVKSNDPHCHSSGDAVKTWQQQMVKRNWKLDVDGQFGPASKDAATQFQRNKGLKADGLVGPSTWAATWNAK
jgi:predicted chitinase